MNKKLLVLIIAVLAASPQTQAGEITLDLQTAIAAASANNADVPIIVRFSNQLDIETLRATAESQLRQKYADTRQRDINRLSLKRTMMVEKMQQISAQSVQQLQAFLKAHGINRPLNVLWSVDSIALKLPESLIGELATQQGIKQITLDAKIQGPGTSTAPTAPNFWNLDATHAPNLWQLGYTGQGTVVASLDTGVDNTHPDLGPKWRGGAHDWFDPYGQNSAPADLNGHGTQVLGLIVAGESGGYQIGMAPDAQWIAAKIFDNSNQATLSGIHAAYQWTLDPDGDLNTDDAPDIINNSWDLAGTVNQCNQEFSLDITYLKEAGMAVLFAGGNFGSAASTSVSPANDPATVSVGAINSILTVDNNSSRGPGACDGGIFPSIVAPGAEIMTTDVMPLFYNYVSGTSFSVAHVSGGMALLKSAFPQATTSQLETAVINNTTDLGDPGPDNTYGNGMLDVQAAYNWLAANIGGTTMSSFSLNASSYSISENTATLIVTVTRTNSTGAASVDYASADGMALAGQDYVTASGTLNFVDGEASRTITLTILNDDIYEGDESFSLSLSNPQGGNLSGGITNATVNILEDDQPPAGNLQFSGAAYSVNENDSQMAVTVVRTNGSFGAATVDYATADSTATAGSDYQSVSGTLNFADGQLSASFTVPLLDDAVYEGDETVALTLGNPTGGVSLGTPVNASLTILENDPAGPPDADNDGFASDVDCNDNNAAVYPGAPEIKYDAVDQDCNGYDLTITLTRVWYEQSADRFTVWATSALNSGAGLGVAIQLANGQTVNQTLSWNAGQSQWQLIVKSFVKKFGSKPASVSVSGIEGSQDGPVELH